MHVCDGGLSRRSRGVEDVGCAAVRVEVAIYRHVEVGDVAVGTEDLLEVSELNIFCEFFDDNLCRND